MKTLIIFEYETTLNPEIRYNTPSQHCINMAFSGMFYKVQIVNPDTDIIEMEIKQMTNSNVNFDAICEMYHQHAQHLAGTLKTLQPGSIAHDNIMQRQQQLIGSINALGKVRDMMTYNAAKVGDLSVAEQKKLIKNVTNA